MKLSFQRLSFLLAFLAAVVCLSARNSLAADQKVVILVHGIMVGGGEYSESYSKFNEIAENEFPNTAIIEFSWGGTFEDTDGPQNGSDSVGNRKNMSVGMSYQAWEGVDKLKKIVKDTRDALGGQVKITIISHSQGTVVTLAAIQEGMRVDNWILMGSPLDEEIVQNGENNTHFDKACKNVKNVILNFSSKSDRVAQLKGGVGYHGLPDNLPNLGKATKYEFNKTVCKMWKSGSLRIYSIPFNDTDHTDHALLFDNGWWSFKWIKGDWPSQFTRDDFISLLRADAPITPNKLKRIKEDAAKPIIHKEPAMITRPKI